MEFEQADEVVENRSICSPLFTILKVKHETTLNLLKSVRTQFKNLAEIALIKQFMQDFIWLLKMADMKITMVYNHNNLVEMLDEHPENKGFYEIYAQASDASKFVLSQL